ncbi:Peptidoglycan-binding (PGRP) domain of peptidoglycan hydrolases-containing protein [Streptomyces sp. 2231.1]|nr:Peptidoglycan-binding (PGRP) domain of peptidoglycan hydrolases-containing protein [Streptomyces sp. 2231.1]
MTSTGAPDRPAVARRAAYIIRTVNMRAPRTVVKLINVHTRGQIHPECEADRMTVPVFEEVDPASDCDCPGCVHWRQLSPRLSPGRLGGHPAARGVVVMAAASAVLGAVHPAAALAPGHSPHREAVPGDGEPATPQGAKAPLHGPAGKPVDPATAPLPTTTRTEIINRAKIWVAAQVPYSMTSYWSDGYRQDCSGYVSMAWGLPNNEWTGSLGSFGVKIKKEELQPGDMLLYHNPDNPESGSHVVLFGGWTDFTHTYYTVYEQTPPHTRRQTTPYPYWSHADKYVPYRYKGVTAGTAGSEPAGGRTVTAYPGAAYFGPGADNKYVTQLGEMLIARGAGSFYAQGAGPVWGEADRRATQAFQQAQGWTGADADGLPGPRTWDLLVTGKGKDIAPGAAGPGRPGSHGVPGYPGRNFFRPGANNDYVTRLGVQLVKKGFGRFYALGPGPHWGEADRRAVEAFQRAQGWRGGAADGYPGPETWRRLFA